MYVAPPKGTPPIRARTFRENGSEPSLITYNLSLKAYSAQALSSVRKPLMASAIQTALARFSRAYIPTLSLTSKSMAMAKLFFMSSSRRKRSLLSVLLATTCMASWRLRTP